MATQIDLFEDQFIDPLSQKVSQLEQDIKRMNRGYHAGDYELDKRIKYLEQIIKEYKKHTP